MARIMLRAHKDPFTVAAPGQVFRKNLIGENVGNLLFQQASYKLLQTEGTEVVTGRLLGGREEAERINDEFDHVVVPLANAFRFSFQSELDRLSETLEHLRVPVTVLGVGAQMNLDGDVARLGRMRASVSRFMRAVLDRSPSVGVRGEFTEQYLHSIGFSEIDVIGCPSLYMNGPDLRVEKRVERLHRLSRISLNLTPYVTELGPLVEQQMLRYPRLRYAAQHREALGMLLDGTRLSAETLGEEQRLLPTHHGHPLIARNRTSFFVDPRPWIHYLSRFDFSFGTRIHGNIAALLAGTPAHVLAHDSRTLELARFYDIPYTAMREVTPDTDAADLYAASDYSAFNAGLPGRFSRFSDYLQAHGLQHVYQAGQDATRFERRASVTPFPGDVSRSLAYRRASVVRAIRGIPQASRHPEPAVA
jgi:hypothetical protein